MITMDGPRVGRRWCVQRSHVDVRVQCPVLRQQCWALAGQHPDWVGQQRMPRNRDGMGKKKVVIIIGCGWVTFRDVHARWKGRREESPFNGANTGIILWTERLRIVFQRHYRA